MTTRTILAGEITTGFAIVEPHGPRRRSLKVCEVRVDGDRINCRVRAGLAIEPRTFTATDPVEVVDD